MRKSWKQARKHQRNMNKYFRTWELTKLTKRRGQL